MLVDTAMRVMVMKPHQRVATKGRKKEKLKQKVPHSFINGVIGVGNDDCGVLASHNFEGHFHESHGHKTTGSPGHGEEGAEEEESREKAAEKRGIVSLLGHHCNSVVPNR